MKKTVFFFALLMILCNSCNNVSEDVVMTESASVENPFDFIGELHNKGLDAARDSMSHENTRSSGTIIFDDIMRYSEGFCQYVYNTDSRFLECPFDEVAMTGAPTRVSEDDFLNAKDTVFSAKAKALLEEIIKVAETNDYNFIKEKFAEYEKEILVLHVSDYTNTDKVILLSSLSVGKYSNEYWKAETTTRAASTSQIVKADLLGAAKGIWKNKFVICVCAVGGVQSVLIAAGRSALPSAIGYSAAQWFIG